MSASASNSESRTSTTNQQLSTQGAAGANSPTVSAGGNVTYQDAGGQVSLAALSGMGDVVKLALQNAAGLNNQAITSLTNSVSDQLKANATAADTNTSLLSSVLANNQQLAQNTQTGGATAAIQQTNYIIWGLIALAGAALAFVFFHKK